MYKNMWYKGLFSFFLKKGTQMKGYHYYWYWSFYRLFEVWYILSIIFSVQLENEEQHCIVKLWEMLWIQKYLKNSGRKVIGPKGGGDTEYTII